MASESHPRGGGGAPASPCPPDMQYVDVDFCTEVQRRCEKDEYTSANKITICHRFAEAAPRCVGETRRIRACVDRFEAPNREGARAPVMIDFWDAMAVCEERGKRLCYESEWTAACEGPDHTPFPYGHERDPRTCNIDNRWLKPSLDKIYDPDPAVHGPELARLDQGVASGVRPACKSGFGVHDQTGNVDEWVLTDEKRGKGGVAALKGGAWGHVRNACRPVTTSHAPEFSYYFVSTRCCADPDLTKAPPARTPALESLPPMKYPPPPTQKKPAATRSRGWTPSK